MSPQRIQHVLTLHLYQPPGALRTLLLDSEAELQRTLKCYERIARHAQKYADVARLHVVFSVPLLMQLRDPEFIQKTRHLIDVRDILEGFRSAPNIAFIASGVQHAPLPLIPREDWDAQLRSERRVIEEAFGHQPKGYYPPGGLFDEAMIPYLAATGYRFALLPSTALINSEGRAVDPYRVYRLNEDFVIVPVDRGFSDAQAHRVEAPWFADEVINGTRIAPAPAPGSSYLVTTWSDGDKGEWFRRSDEENGFFGHFFAPYMEFCETGEYPIRPVNLVEYLKQAEPEPVRLAEQAVPKPDHPALQQLRRVSALFWEKTQQGVETDPSVRELLLQAEGSCFVLDQDPDKKRLTALLGAILDKLKPQKSGQATNGGDQVRADVSSSVVGEASSKKPLAGQASAKGSGSGSRDKAESGNERDRQGDDRTSSVSTSSNTKKTAAPGKNRVKGGKSTASRGTSEAPE
jgi:peptidoglycan/xylan/chitin deacetylase (PgdA/CDA1 family)